MMNIIARYKRLNTWNKVGFWGAVASIAAILITIIFFVISQYFGSTKENQVKILEKVEENIELTKEILYLVKEGQRYYDTNWKELKEKYPGGYAMFIVDKEKNIWKPWKSHFSEKFEIYWDTAEVSELTEEFITIKLPTITSPLPSGEKLISSGINIMAVRKIGILGGRQSIQYKSFTYEVVGEILVDDSEGLICIIGLKIIKQDDV